ncbi:putative reverse transcriptase zinc-binding domain-containing protein [Helianthus annuus]|nr:putative reverse transcriptase zinc-binding domain-containing protein [Helianthus annuus]
MLERLEVNGSRFSSCLRGKIGNGERIIFWKDVWYGNVPFMDRWPCLFAQDQNKNAVVAVRFQQNGDRVGIASFWNFNTDSVAAISEAQDVQAVASQVRMNGGKDKWVWNHCSSGKFSVAAVKHWLGQNYGAPLVRFMRWESWLPSKINIFIWRLELDRIPTRMALVNRRVNIIDSRCPFCEFAHESAFHLIVDCDFVKGVWSKIRDWCRIQGGYFDSIIDLLKMDYIANKPKWEKKLLRGIMMITCWRIWLERNSIVFHKSRHKVVDIIAGIKSSSFCWVKNRTSFKDLVWKDWGIYPLYML